MRLVTSKSRAIQKHLETLSEDDIFGAIWSSLNREDCNFIKQGQTQFYSTTHCLQSSSRKRYASRPRISFVRKKAWILKPRVVLKANPLWDSQDLPTQEARSSWESQQDAESYGETRSNTADCRILGQPISTVKLQDARRQNNVTKLIEMFEKKKHQRKEQFLKDLSQKQKISRFSEESQQKLADMNHTEIFELHENSAKQRCPDCTHSSKSGSFIAVAGEFLKY